MTLIAIFTFITLVLMIASAVILDSAGIGESSNQQSVDNSIAQYGILQIVTVCLAGPVVEEVFYRGIIFETLKGKNNHLIRGIVAVVLTALVFAFSHVSVTNITVNDLLANIPIFMLGLTLSSLHWKTNNIFCPILLHIAINSIATFG